MSELTKEHLDEQFEKMASIIKKSFDGVDVHFEGVNSQFDNVNSRLDRIEGDLKVVQTKLDRALYTEVVYLEARIKPQPATA